MKDTKIYSTIAKTPTGIPGFDDITLGGLPKNRPTLLLGNAGSGKTIFALEFLVNGINKFSEKGIFISFEERLTELVDNFCRPAVTLSL